MNGLAILLVTLIILFGGVSVYITVLQNKVEKAEREKIEQYKKEQEMQKYADANKTKEKMETGNVANDIDASIDILHDLATGGKTKT